MKHTLLLVLFYFYTNAQIKCTNEYTHKNIKTVIFKSKQKEWFPMIYIKNDKLSLYFDNVENDDINYTYTITLCDYKWRETTIKKQEYLSSMQENYINEINASFNTAKSYMNYHLQIPNEGIQIKLSGNYILKVFESENKNPVIIRKFIVYEQHTNINAVKVRPYEFKNYNTHQKIEISVNLNNLQIDNYDNIKTVIYQNFGFKNFRINEKPSFILGNKLLYLSAKNTFEGGNEYRHFNIGSTRITSPRIDAIEFRDNLYNAFITQDSPLKNEPYFNSEDINGNFLIKSLDSKNHNTESDYIRVKFELKTPKLLGSKIYIYGGFNNWELNKENKMQYDYENGIYYTSLILKQGFYNYKYVELNPNKKTPIDGDGSFFETKNDYFVIVYLRSLRLNNYKVIGVYKNAL